MPKVSVFNVHKRFPKLYGKTKTDVWKTWEIWVETLQGDVLLKWQTGLEGGKLTLHTQEITKGKNIGKKNETTPVQQAVKDAQSRWQKQVDKNMVEDKSLIDDIFKYFPMLAKTGYSPWSHDVVIGKKKITTLPPLVILQRKLNGVRCPVIKKRNRAKLYSRGGKEYTQICDVLTQHLSHIMKNGDKWDGEIYVHGWSLERISQAVKRDKSKVWRKKVLYHVKKKEWDAARWWVKTRNDTQRLEYHRYDNPTQDLTAEWRIDSMDYLPTSDLVFQEESFCDIVGDWDNIKTLHDKWVREGYEGVIIRDPDALYLWGGRGKRLIKYKEFQDEEFEIIGYRQGTGSDKGAVVWECRGKDEAGTGYIYFDCRPRGSIEYRRRLFKRGQAYIGKMLTVRFFERTDKYVPQFPVGITIRDYE